MPAPTFIKTQITSECADGGGFSTDETQLTRGNVEVNSNCCRTYGKSVTLTGVPGNKGLTFEGPVATCSGTGNGMKTYSGNSYGLCGGSSVRGTHSGSGTIVGAAFSGSGTGTATGISPGAYSISISGSFTSPGNGSFTGTLSGALVGTVSGTIVSNAVTGVTYVFTSPAGTGTGNSNVFTIGGGGTTFTFSGSIAGLTTSVAVYWVVEWTDCSVGGVVAQMFNAADDSLIAEYSNETYCVKNGRITMLNRTFVTCNHPCMAAGLSQRESFLKHPLSICFVPQLTMARCRGGNRSTQYTTTMSGSTHPWLSAFDGISASSSGYTPVGAAGNGTPSNSTLTGQTQMWGMTTSSATMDFTFTGGANWQVSAEGYPCGELVNAQVNGGAGMQWGDIFTGRVSGTLTLTGGGFPFAGFYEPNRPFLAVITWSAPATNPNATHDYCAGDMVDVKGPQAILIQGVVQVDTGGGLYQNVSFAINEHGHSVTMTISHNDVSYPPT